MQEVVKALIDEAEQCYEYSKDTKCVLTTFFKAVDICMKYHLDEDSVLIITNDAYCKSLLYAIEQGLVLQ